MISAVEPEETKKLLAEIERLKRALKEKDLQIATLEEQRHQLYREATISSITDLLKKDPFIRQVSALLQDFGLESESSERRRQAENGPGIIAFIDLNHMKQLNDWLGHTGTDAVLYMFARWLERSCRKDDVVMNPYGDEYVIFAPYADPDQVGHAIGRRLTKISADAPVVCPSGTIMLNFVIGIAPFPKELPVSGAPLAVAYREQVTQVIEAADSRMNSGKQLSHESGRPVLVYPDSDGEDHFVVL